MPMYPPVQGRLRMRILLAEDDANFATLLSNELKDEQTSVEWVNNGVEAILRLMRQPFDAVLLDLRMPRLDGLSALRIIHILHPEMAVITFSGVAGDEEKGESVRLGARICLSKPFPIDQLKKMLMNLQS